MKDSLNTQFTYDSLVDKARSRVRTNLLISISMLIVGLLLIHAGQKLGLLFILMCAAAWLFYYSGRARLIRELDNIDDEEEFRRQLENADYLENCQLILTRDYAVSGLKNSFHIYPFAAIAKFEVGLSDTKRILFLTDRDGERHPVAEYVKGYGDLKYFDEAYNKVREHFPEQQRNGSSTAPDDNGIENASQTETAEETAAPAESSKSGAQTGTSWAMPAYNPLQDSADEPDTPGADEESESKGAEG